MCVCVCVCVYLCVCAMIWNKTQYVSTQPLHHEQDETQGPFFSGGKLV